MQYDSKKYQASAPPKGGDYTFYVTSAEDKVSTNGNDMIKLKLEVTIPGRDKSISVYDNLVASDAALFKIKQFCDAVGLVFEDNELTARNCLSKSGYARFALGMPKQDGNRYLEVKEYYPANQKSSTTPQSEAVDNEVAPITDTTDYSQPVDENQNIPF